ncbi:hypothetical protein JUN65_10055 [Gluconacetobacter azotocaptans]|uniref:hypothetical protein n=1 Tax=Gluconacetobacter azotocaptans TaxID=142834 RepID=UPI00195B57D0|nr:hypothetical protein [Gluconacetobacter azotocaptans]MBM9401927.1 hypothetical protein [Gluconacetobacter azotocaptans]
MRYLLLAIFPATALAMALMAGTASVMARDRASPVLLSAQAAIDGAPGARLAGYLNFCITNALAAHETTTPLLDSLIRKTGAVPRNHSGNVDYAYGTAGVLRSETANVMRFTDFDIPERRGLCDRATRKAGSTS